MDGSMDKWINGQMDGLMDKWINGQMNRRMINELVNVSLTG